VHQDTFIQYFRESPAWGLLRFRSSPEVLAFLDALFKDKDKPALLFHEAEIALADYWEFYRAKEAMDAAEEEAEGIDTPKPNASQALGRWVKRGWLRKYPDERGVDWIELTPDTEKALQFVKSLERKDFVGTESRFKDIFRRLRDLVEGSQEDPAEKIAELNEKINSLKASIRLIEQTGKVEVYSDTQIKERFFEITKSARELLSDFKEVEQNFKEITRGIYQRQAERTMTRGGLLGYALDRIDELKDNDQGRSFYSFWEFLISDARQDELKLLVGKVLDLLTERNILARDPLLTSLKRQLHANGQKVFESNQMLAEKLNRIIAEQNLKDRKRVLQTIDEIRDVAMKGGAPIGTGQDFWAVEAEAAIMLPMDRPLGEPAAVQMETIRPDEADTDLENLELQNLFDNFFVNTAALEQKIRELLRSRVQVSLEEVLEVYPISQGLAEVITYMGIASGSQKHFINEKEKFTVELDPETGKKVQVPQIIYTH
jgi:DNA-binding MarR family transcriptional regulator